MDTNNTIANSLYAQANGVSSSSAFVDIFLPRNPTSNDIGPPYQTQKKWLNTTNGAFWILSGFTSAGGGLQAVWLEITGFSGIGIKTLEGNSGGLVFPTVSGNLNVVGSGLISVSGNPSTNTLTITSAGGIGITWNNITASQTLATNNGYFCNSPGGVIDLLLPAVSSALRSAAVPLCACRSPRRTPSP